MTNEEAAAVFATLPVPAELRLSISGDRITMWGPRWGGHSLSISASTPERVRIHWRGFCENYGYKVEASAAHVLHPCPAPAAAPSQRALQPGDRVTVLAGGIWRRVQVVRVTAKRVLVTFYYKYCYDQHGRLSPSATPCIRWYKKSEVRS